MNNIPFVVYGTGSGARDVFDSLSSNECLAVVDRKNDLSGEFCGVELKHDSFLNEINEDYNLIVASQYFDLIYERLSNEGKLSNQHIKGIFVPNLLSQKPPYGDTNNKITEAEYDELFELFGDEKSRELLTIIKNERQKDSYPLTSYIPYDEGIKHAGREDYWITVKPVKQHSKSVIIDAGAYVGDSINGLVQRIGNVESYYALEPMAETFQTLEKAPHNGVKRFCPMNVGLGSECVQKPIFSDEQTFDASSFDAKSGYRRIGVIDIVTLDSLDLKDKDCDYFFKADIEGSELEALHGAERFIQEMHPNLAICLYHRERDLYEIPKYIKNIAGAGYKFYLVGGSHTIMIANKCKEY